MLSVQASVSHVVAWGFSTLVSFGLRRIKNIITWEKPGMWVKAGAILLPHISRSPFGAASVLLKKFRLQTRSNVDKPVCLVLCFFACKLFEMRRKYDYKFLTRLVNQQASRFTIWIALWRSSPEIFDFFRNPQVSDYEWNEDIWLMRFLETSNSLQTYVCLAGKEISVVTQCCLIASIVAFFNLLLNPNKFRVDGRNA